MAIGRTMLAVLIALAVALLPAAAGAAFKAPPARAMEMSASQTMDDGCPGPADSSDKAAGDCTSMAACAVNCFNFVGLDPALLPSPPVQATIGPVPTDEFATSRPTNPPFRPPRI